MTPENDLLHELKNATLGCEGHLYILKRALAESFAITADEAVRSERELVLDQFLDSWHVLRSQIRAFDGRGIGLGHQTHQGGVTKSS